MVEITECPRDAIQGIATHIPPTEKLQFHKHLLSCGFKILDFGSFVSPKAIPQLADTQEVAEWLAEEEHSTELLTIVANERGAQAAAKHANISWIGYPLALSETFQQRNTNRSIAQARTDLVQLIKIAKDANQKICVYLSMGFGNPYSDEWNIDVVLREVERLQELGVHLINLSDTVGSAKPEIVEKVGRKINKVVDSSLLALHLHASPAQTKAKIKAGLQAGFTKFDSALYGFGGCPMAGDKLVGNVDTRVLINTIEEEGFRHSIREAALAEAEAYATELYAKYTS